MAILKRKTDETAPASAATATAAAKVNEALAAAAAAAQPVTGTATTVAPAAPANPVPTPTGADQPAAPPAPDNPVPTPTLPAVATAASAPAVFLGKKKGFVYDGYENMIPAMGFGDLPRIIASGGFIMDGDKRVLGSYVKTQLMSWNKRYCISPNQDGAPSDLAKFSLDNVTMDNDPSLTVVAHLQELKALGYTKAASKEYVEVICLLLDAEKPTELTGELVQLQLSPTMHPAFVKALNVQTTFKIVQGLITEQDALLITWHTEPATSSKVNKTWTKLVPKLSVFDNK